MIYIEKDRARGGEGRGNYLTEKKVLHKDSEHVDYFKIKTLESFYPLKSCEITKTRHWMLIRSDRPSSKSDRIGVEFRLFFIGIESGYLLSNLNQIILHWIGSDLHQIWTTLPSLLGAFPFIFFEVDLMC